MEQKSNKTVIGVIVGLVVVVLLGLGIYALVNNSAEEEATSESTETTQEVAPAQSIVEIASSNPDFSTLVTALEAADLVDTLSGEGPFTVFAPTNAAFDALPEGTLDSLLADPAALANVLTYHVVAGNVPAGDVVNLTSATTLQGQDVSIEVVEGSVVLNGSVNVVQTDILGSNGIIHVIDAVLIPQE
jgi:uncharacterized surface protein with fasciclin (FAS1) repeats